MLPIGVGIKENRIPVTLKSSNTIHLARYSMEHSRGTLRGRSGKCVVWIVDEINNCVARAGKSPALPLDMLHFAILGGRLCERLSLVVFRIEEPSYGRTNSAGRVHGYERNKPKDWEHQ